MGPPPILSSPLLNLGIINSLLASSPSQPTTEVRIQLLSAKVHLLSQSLSNTYRDTNKHNRDTVASSSARTDTGSISTPHAHPHLDLDTRPNSSSSSASGRQRIVDEMELLRVRLDLGRGYLQSMSPQAHTHVHEAETELGIVERDCRGMIKRLKGRRRRDEKGNERRGGSRNGDMEDLRKHDGEVSRTGVNDEMADEDAAIMRELGELRMEALREMICVEEALGRGAKAERWRKAIADAKGEEALARSLRDGGTSAPA